MNHYGHIVICTLANKLQSSLNQNARIILKKMNLKMSCEIMAILSQPRHVKGSNISIINGKKNNHSIHMCFHHSFIALKINIWAAKSSKLVPHKCGCNLKCMKNLIRENIEIHLHFLPILYRRLRSFPTEGKCSLFSIPGCQYHGCRYLGNARS